MAQFRRNTVSFIKLLPTLLLLSILSPLPELPARLVVMPAPAPSDPPADIRIVIWKSNYTLTLYRGDAPLKTYRAVFGKGYQDGDKRRQGDKRTPEGDFYICTMKESKRFYKFLGLSYPALKHAEAGVRAGMISLQEFSLIKKALDEHQQPPWDTELGGAIGIHGRLPETPDLMDAPRSLDGINWTDGCIAMSNADIDDLFSVVSLGTPVTILP
jgi:murein L,D-transpeptidase YafK